MFVNAADAFGKSLPWAQGSWPCCFFVLLLWQPWQFGHFHVGAAVAYWVRANSGVPQHADYCGRFGGMVVLDSLGFRVTVLVVNVLATPASF